MPRKTTANERTTIWVAKADLARATALVTLLAEDPQLKAMGTVNRSDVLRMALTWGLDVLETIQGTHKQPGQVVFDLLQSLETDELETTARAGKALHEARLMVERAGEQIKQRPKGRGKKKS